VAGLATAALEAFVGGALTPFGGAAGASTAGARPGFTTITFAHALQVTRNARPWIRSSGTEYRRPQRSHAKITGS